MTGFEYRPNFNMSFFQKVAFSSYKINITAKIFFRGSTLVMQFEKNTFVFFSKKTVFYDEKNMTSEKNTESVFFVCFFIINYVLKIKQR